uniref:Basement membrane-specific heparan sulfate proteoglycan core protein n=1 Tax=Musca domestica TaxID=7370 RepID=T1PLQ8_MUSDO
MVYDCDQNPDGDFQCANGDVIPCYKRCNNYVDCLDESDEEPDMCKVVLEREEEEIEESTNEDEDNWGSWPNVNKETSTDDSWVTPESHPDAGHHDTHAVEEDEEEKEEEEEHSPTYETIDYDRPIDAERRVEEPVNAGGNVYGGEEDHHHGGAGGLDNNIFESSGDYSPVTETSAVFTPPTGCRGDSTYTCRESNVQICDEHLCDGVEHCPDGEDELNCGSDDEFNYEKVCSANEFMCDQRCLPMEYRCNGYNECNDGSDERDCPEKECKSTEYKCRAGNCIDSARRCDNIRDCPDGDDEDDRCRCAPDQFRCRNGDCIPSYYHCNGHRDCMDNSDEEECADPAVPASRCLPSQFRCDNGQCISAYARCNGYVDCADSSDERYCPDSPTTPAPQLNLKTYPDNQIIKERREVIFRCRDEGMLRAKVRWTRPGGRPLPVGAVDKDGRLEIPNIRVEDGGTYVCEAVGYPRHVSGQQVSVQLTVEKYNPRDDRLPSACSAIQATCMNGECIDKSQICDGIPHCSDGSDEHSCSQGRKCQPNQFMCRNSKCVDRVWRCDGENDCGDNSDEESCDPEPSGAPCRYDEFQCRSGHCIPKSFQCDDTNDCRDGSDEIGCMAPDKLREPPPTQFLRPGDSLNLTCVGVGTPTPVIVWRLNWGHVPEKCVSKSYSGTGTLYCPDMQYGDSGAYSCEIINSKGSKFTTDTMVTVERPERPGVCSPGTFNDDAQHSSECLNCFCFGIAKSCKSSDLFISTIQPPITSHRVVNVELSPYSNIVINEAPSSGILNLRHGVQFRASDVLYGSRSTPYLALPADFMGNQLKSYGGYLKYDVRYDGTGTPTRHPDVIVTGNGFTLTYRSRSPAQPSFVNHMEIPFVPGSWTKTDGRSATREEIMMVLTNVDNVLVRLGYIEATEREVEVTNIMMTSAGPYDQGLGQASLVEKCSCPVGYSGDSCESCAPGYVRQPGGAWLGRCVPHIPEPCPEGTYGDPRRGIPCRECPCPQTGANNFATGCSLGPDNEVTCRCNEGYMGRRCETCAPGYEGNPLAPGGRCYPTPDHNCNAEGTYSIMPNKTCECKSLVSGERCDTCKSGSFHLNSFTYTGCIECFCSGLPVSCGSSTWNRDQITSSFGRSRAPHGFSLIRNYNTEPAPVPFNENGASLTFNEPSTSEPLYWSLPAQFLGNQITAYGGKLSYNLSYNPMPGGLMSRSTSPDVVIKSGEDVTLIHYRKTGFNPSQPNSYSIQMIENSWQRSDGQTVNRQHLLMALSKIDAIYIKATYTTSTKNGALTSVSMDIASASSRSGARAWEVEECRCPPGYVGTSCERCAPGYKRNEEAGLYLGLCEPCECNGHSSQCDAETGVCLNCADNTEGDFCERCAYGYVGDATGGTPYDCVSQGSPRPPQPPQPPQNETCYHCNQAGTASCYGDYCYCKSNVQGSRCDQCRPGTYALSADNPDGCEECFCSGKSTTCSAASLYRQLIPVDFFGSPPLFTDEEGQIADRDNLNFDVARNEYTYSYTSYTPKYWSLRGSVLGNQLYSYGGELSYTLSVDSYGHYEPGNDVVLIGNGMKLIWSRPNAEQDNEEYKIRLHEDENWQTMQRGGMQRASRLDFMNVLQNLEHILIRATPKIPTQRSSISDVILESAVETPQPGAEQAIDIEMCNCPPEYSGSSCESCAPLHYRQTDGSCRRCPCQDDNTQSCSLDERGYVKCQCRSGYAGDRCQNMEDDGSGPIISTTPQPEYKTQITVSIKKPVISIVPIGGSITLSCSGYFAYNRAPVVVTWYKLNGDMPFHYEQADGVLRLYDLQIHDSGTYICQARNDQTQHIFQDNVTITITESSRRSPAKIDSLAPYHTFTEYVPNEIVCDVSGNPTPTVTWIRVDNQMSTEVTVEGNRLIFDRPRKSDEGRYRCQASNGEGYADEKYTEVYVETAVAPSTPAPRETVYIEPPYYAGEAGQTVRLTCHSISNINLKYEWTKDGYPIYRQHNIILLDNTLEIRDSSPRDSGTYTCVGIDMRGRRNYTSDARVNVEESRDSTHTYGTPPVIRTMREEHLVVQGHDFTITCEASGNPRPTIKWTKVHESLGDNVHQSGNVLRISSARPDNRGVYVCVAENNVASDQASTYIEIEPRERPTVDIDPKEPQVLNVGSQGMLYCTATGIPTPRVQWSRVDGLPMSPRHQMQHNEPGYIVIDNLALEDTGDYKCEATNEVGSATAISTIRVIEAPVISLQPDLEIVSVTEGDELKITCSAKGTPTPNVRWIKEDVVSYGFTPALAGAQSNEAVLEFYRVSMQDAKTYKCIATNEAGTDERYVVLDVKYRRGDVGPDGDVDDSRLPTYNPYPPPYTRPETVMETKPGENVTLICDLQNSFRTIWERDDGRPLPDNSFYDGTKLVIYHMTENSAGRYRCNSLDNRGSILRFHLWELRYLPVPRITLHPEMPIRVNVNSDVTITCNVEGPQPIAVSWHTDNNRPLTASVSTNNEYLNFREITPAAAGRYYCLASNAYGNSTAYAEVIVNRGRTYESQPQARQYQIMEGEDIFMTCDVEANLVPVRGEIHYNWRREDGQPLPPNAMVRSNRLAINNVRQQDGGRYICESYTANGVSPPSYADLYVKPGVRPMPQPYYPPAPLPHYSTTTPRHRDLSLKLDQQHSNLRVGESTEVECYSSDNSYTDVVWERADGKPLPLHIKQIGNRLIINHVTPDDAGNYLCKCKTDEGDLYTTSYELAIEANTHEWKHPKIEHAEVGSAVKLHCDAEDAHLSPHYRWSRQYGQMQMGTDILSDTLSLQNVQANDAGTYVCTATAPNGESVDYPTILVVTGAIPHFHQEPLSYMSFPTLRDSYVKFNFDITFRPEQGDGLLLFNGQKRGNGDYISLSLNDQYPEFRFDLDGKTMIVRGEQALTLNEWHTIRVHRFRRDGYMQVDGEHPIAFPTLSASSSLDLAEDLYLGGVPSWDILPEEAIEQQIGFAGCISRLTLQDSIIELMKEAKMKEGITACKPCDSNPCSNSGICLESQTEMGYTCVCQQGWTGRHCAVEGTQCTPGICGTGRCENTETGMECLCPLNKTGDRCQYIEHLNENSLAFKKNSFAAYGTPRASKLNIKFQVRPNSLEDAVLLYAAESRLPSGDYVAVVLRNKHVELIINTGARLKPVVVRSLHPLPANKWTEIEIARRFGEGILRVGTDPEQKAKAAGAARTLYIKTPMYVGGFDHEKITLNRDVNITQGFDGCISNLFEGQRQLNLIADIQDAANIQNCGEINEIEQNETFDHDVEQNACSSDPCENGGTCVVENDEAVCLCNIGFAGKHCEDHISLQFDANFHGNGYLELNRSQFDENVEQKFSSAAMVFSTTAPDGLLLWWGQPKGEAYTGQDFMAVAIVDGIAEFAFRLNGEEKVIRNPDKRVDDGIRHILLIKRTDNTAILELDHILYADETKDTGKDTMSLPGHVFIGGAPNLESFTGGRYKHHFNGCVRVVEGEASGIIEVGKVAISGNNVDTCPNADEDVDFDGTEPPVV